MSKKYFEKRLLLCWSDNLYTIFYSLRGFIERLLKKNSKKIYFLHVPKTGGTFIKKYIELNSNYFLYKTHFYHCNFLLEKEKYILSIRNPVDRIVSAFYFAKGRKHTAFDEFIFNKYNDINSLAEDLSSFKKKWLAILFLRYIRYINYGYRFYYKKKYTKNLIYILEQENMFDDLNKLFKKLNINQTVEDKIINKNTEKKYPALTPKALNNLNKFFKEDYKIYKQLKNNKDYINFKFLNQSF